MHLVRRAVVAASSLLFCAACVPPAAQPVALPLRPYATTALRTVNVTVGGRQTPFIFDTGAGFTVIDTTELAAAGCAPFGRVTGFRADGHRITMSRCGPVTLGMGRYAVTGEVGILDLGSLLGNGAPPVGGLIGMASFAGRAVTLDLAHDRVTVETAASLARRIRGMHPVNVRLVRGAGGDLVPFIEVRARTGTLWLEIDSGNNGPVFLSPVAQGQLGIRIPPGGQDSLMLDVVGLGPVPVVARTRDMIYDGQLDPPFLRQMRLTVDFATSRAWAVLAPAT
jgi:Aspartyl protease